ncbi:hypothetical protein SKAU_G00067070 [Synaphobranchus kaupii]|uniref:E-selectin n=1 Tax=Synaphobranchus kaupii TaxID=118154 RepID=A0A9Q1JBD0_SYNKA|nr:hypothetical protein SKAU_G00067070 [Synaphobranchus kaupii]
MEHSYGKQRVCGVRILNSLALITFLHFSSWKRVDGWSYHYSSTIMNWENARLWCKEHYTDMVAIQNQEEIAHLNEYLPRQRYYYWIGIRKINSVWTWVGTKKTLTEEAKNWATGEPNNGKNNEDCVEIYIKRAKDTGKWNDESCKKRKTALCYTASCLQDSCSGHGECVETINSHECKCLEGFSGDKCEHVVACEAMDNPRLGSCSHPFGNFSYNSTCQFTCEDGYQLSDSRPIRCTASGTWSAEPPHCEAVLCSELVSPIKGYMDCAHPLGNFSYMSSCTFSCDKGYRLIASNELTCGSAGQWSDSQPHCEAVRCPLLQVPQEGNMTCSADPSTDFSYGSTCTFSCAAGFQLHGVPSVICTESAQWSQETPRCEAISCVSPEGGAHVTMDCSHSLDSLRLNSSCTFSCDEGFVLQGAESVRCSETGEWNAETPTCTAVRCPSLEKPIDGSMVCSNDELSYGSTCSFSCAAGFQLQGVPSVVCSESAQWSQETPRCEAISCVSPKGGAHVTMDCSHSLDSLRLNSSCTFSCDEGFVLQGAESVRCSETGEWNAETPTCTAVRCPSLEKPIDGSMVCSNDELSYGSTCSFSCAAGFQLQGVPSVICSESAQWSQETPRCEAISCVSPEGGAHVTMDCSHSLDSLRLNSSCTFSCDEGFVLQGAESVRCSETGEWNAETPTCTAVRCPSLEKPIDGSMVCSSDELSYGSTCSFSCASGFQLQGVPSVVCSESAQWSQETPRCEAISCVSPKGGAHVTMDCSHSLDSLRLNSSCTFSCDEGFVLQGAESVRCSETGEWNAETPTCTAVRCPSLEKPIAGSMVCSNDELSYGSTCSFSCAAGFQLQGVPSVVCSESAQWSQETPRCEAISCVSPEGGAHVTMNCSHSLDSLRLNSRCTFSCDEGFVLQGAESVRCSEAGEWNAETPTCTAVTCPSLEKPIGGNVVCSNMSDEFSYAYSYGSNCNFTCDTGFDLQGSEILTCNIYGNWTEEVPTCQARPEPLLNPTSFAMAAGGTMGLTSLFTLVLLLKRLRQRAKHFELNSSIDDDIPPQVYKNSIDSLI